MKFISSNCNFNNYLLFEEIMNIYLFNYVSIGQCDNISNLKFIYLLHLNYNMLENFNIINKIIYMSHNMSNKDTHQR